MTAQLAAADHRVLALVAAGLGPAEIARERGVTPDAINKARQRLRARIGGRNDAQLVALACAKRLLDPAAILQAERLAVRAGLVRR